MLLLDIVSLLAIVFILMAFIQFLRFIVKVAFGVVVMAFILLIINHLLSVSIIDNQVLVSIVSIPIILVSSGFVIGNVLNVI